MRILQLAAITLAPILFMAAAADPASSPGQVSSDKSYAPATGKTAEPYEDADKLVTKGVPGLVSQVTFINERFDVVYLRTRLLNGSIRNIRIGRGQQYAASAAGEPAICMCWHFLNPVYQCLNPDAIAVPAHTTFRFGQGGSFQTCTASF